LSASQPKASEVAVAALLGADPQSYDCATALFSVTTRAVLGVSKESQKPDAGANSGVSKESPNREWSPSKGALTELGKLSLSSLASMSAELNLDRDSDRRLSLAEPA
jgi:hypothetical protein